MPQPNLSTMPVDALLKLRADIDKTLSSRAAQLRNELSKLSAGGSLKASHPLKGRKAPVKYRSPSGETWAGRGAKPRWLVAAIKKGKKVEDFLIERKRRAKR
jgi:DNA-binding protein H-NS